VIWLWEERVDGVNIDTVAAQTVSGITSATAGT
jgi:hypothetical protein